MKQKVLYINLVSDFIERYALPQINLLSCDSNTQKNSINVNFNTTQNLNDIGTIHCIAIKIN